MQTTTKLGGAAIVACAACCAVSIVPAVLAGTSLVAIGGAASTWGVWLALALPVGGIYAISRRKAAPSADVEVPSEADSCGCGAACGSSEALRADRLNV